VNWERHPVAIAPSDQGPDADGVWSGCVVDHDGIATAIYTGVVTTADGDRTQSVCLATSTDDDLVSWVKDSTNPVSVEPPPYEVKAFRDPFVWRDNGIWVMLLGTGLPNGCGAVFRYVSQDLRDWRYQGVFASGSPPVPGSPWTGSVWECPSLAMTESGEAVLLVSVHDPTTASLHFTTALIGEVTDGRLNVSSVQRVDHGHDCYAVALEKNSDGRILGYGWTWDAVSQANREELGSTGALTIPREMAVLGGALSIAPAAEVDRAFVVVHSSHAVSVVPGEPIEVAMPLSGRIHMTLTLDHASTVRIGVRKSATSGEELLIDYNPSRSTVIVDRRRASSDVGALGGISSADYLLPDDRRFDAIIFIDETIAEIFIGGALAFTERIYPQAIDAHFLRIEACNEHFGERPASFVVDQLEISMLAHA
jgi:beta-fructofuranosidase